MPYTLSNILHFADMPLVTLGFRFEVSRLTLGSIPKLFPAKAGDSAPDITAHWKSRRRRLLLYPIQLPTSTAVFCFDWITDNL